MSASPDTHSTGAQGRELMCIASINGAPGVGKTSAGQTLLRMLPSAALIDTDELTQTHPFRIDHRHRTLLENNLFALARGYRDWGARVIIVSGVAQKGLVYDMLQELSTSLAAPLQMFLLRARRDVIRDRLRLDPHSPDPESRLAWCHLDDELAELPQLVIVDTNDCSTSAVASRLFATLIKMHPPLGHSSRGNVPRG